jgi:hypothetical protein
VAELVEPHRLAFVATLERLVERLEAISDGGWTAKRCAGVWKW